MKYIYAGTLNGVVLCYDINSPSLNPVSHEIIQKDNGFMIVDLVCSPKDVDNLFTMNGPMIYKMARKHVYTMLNEDLRKMGINRKDITLLVPHQASGLAVKAYVKYGKFNPEQVMDIISYTGNCVAASLPLALAIGYEENRFKRGDLVYLIGTGAGLSVASTLIRF